MKNGKLSRLANFIFKAAVVVVVIAGIRIWQQRNFVEGPAPAFSAKDLAGRAVSLEDYSGRPLLLYFWASWCGVCRMQQSVVDKIAQDWPVLGIALQSGEVADIERFKAAHKLSFQTLTDPAGELGSQYGVRGVPATFILDEDGRIRFAEAGYTTELGLRARLNWVSIF